MGPNEPINPLTFKGKDKQGNPLHITVWRFWLKTQEAQVGQNVLNTQKKEDRFEKRVQIAIWATTEKLLAGYKADENYLVPAFKKVRIKKAAKVPVSVSTASLETEAILSKDAVPAETTINIQYNNGLIEIAPQDNLDYTLYLDYNHFIKGLPHLFVKGELDG